MSKKNIIAIIAIVVLLFIAGISVGVFLYDKGETEAVDGNQIVDETQVSDGTQAEENIQNGENNNQPEDADLQESVTYPDAGNEDITTTDNEVTGEVENNDTENNNENVNNEVETENTDVTTNTNVNEVGETTISRVEEQERLVSRDFWDWWKPVEVEIIPTAIGVREPQITVKKAVITGVAGDELTYIGQDITYVIAVTNNGEDTVENIEITDKIPQNTTFVSIKDAKISSEVVGTKTTIGTDNKITGVKWGVTIPAGETVIAEFTVNVNKTMINEDGEEVETTGTILNTAIANGEESNDGEPTKTSIIRTNKSSVITRLNKETEKYEEVQSAKIGDLITYTITVENTGDSEGTTYILDKVPEGTKLISAEEAMISENADSVAWSVTLDANQTITRQFTVEVVSINSAIKNVADVGGTPTNEDKVETADIEIIKTVIDIKREGLSIGNDAEVKAGDVIEYKIKVTNKGSLDLTNVVVDEQLEGIKVDEKELQIGYLAAGESVEINATYKVVYETDIKNNPDRVVINEVYVSGETIPDAENPDKEPEKVEDEDETETPVEETPLVNVIKFADKEIVKAGDIVNYTITVTNTGNVTLLNVPVTDSLTTSTGVQNLTIYSDNSYTTSITEIPRLEVTGEGSSVTLYAKYEVTQADIDAQTVITNVATANDTPSNEVPVTPEDDEPSVSVVKAADKEIVKAGDVVNYTITVTNTGNVTLLNVPVTDSLTTSAGVQNLTIYSDSNYENVITTIDRLEVTGEDSSVTLYAKYEVTQADIDAQTVITNVATANDTPSNEVEVTPEDDEPGVSVVKSADKEIVKAGDIVNYTITVTNIGNVTLLNVPVTDSLTTSAGVQNLTIYSDSNYENVITTIDRLEVTGEDSSVTLYAKYEVTQADIDAQTVITNVATANDTPSNEVEVTPEDEEPSVSVVKAADKEIVKAGDIVNYTITVTNTGNITLLNVPVTDSLTTSAGVQNLTIYSDSNYENVITTIDRLEVTGEGSSVTLYAKYEVTQADIDAQTVITNVAVANDTPSNEVPVTPEDDRPGVSVVKSADKEIVKAGDVVNYTITVTNTGNVTLLNVPVTDSLITSTGVQNLTIYSDSSYTTPITEIPRLEVTGEGSSVTLYAKYEVTQADIDAQTVITNVATANDTPSNEVPVTPVNNETSVTVTKIWDDGSNTSTRQDITIKLYYTKNNEKVEVSTVTPIIDKTNQNQWTYTFENLPKYDGNTEIQYKAEESNVPEGYIPSYSDDSLTITNTYVTVKKESVTDTNKVISGDTIEYVITVKNHGTTTVDYKVQDSDLLALLNAEKVVMLNGETVVDKDNACITVSGSRDNISAQTIADGYIVEDITANETVTINIKVKVHKVLPGDEIINTLVGKDSDDTKVENEVSARIDVIKTVPNPQDAVVVIDLSLSMAQAVQVPETQKNLTDPMAYTYEDTRWYALTQALDSFIDSFMKNSDGTDNSNTITIVGYNSNIRDDSGAYLLLDSATTATEAKAIYANVFTETQFNKIKNEVNSFNWQQIQNWNNKYNTDIDINSSVREIDVDGLKDTTIFSSSEMTKLGSGTNIEAGLLKAKHILGNGDLSGKHVILMTDGAANKSVTGVTNGDYYTVGSSASTAQIITAASSITNSGAKLYTVALSLDSSQTATLKTIASSTGSSQIGTDGKFFYTAQNTNKLEEYFKTISKTISSGQQLDTLTTDGKLILSDEIQIDPSAVTSITIIIEGKTMPITTWAQFEKYYDATARTIDIRKMIDDYNNTNTDKIESITGDVQITIVQ